jgi:hypothetical protein
MGKPTFAIDTNRKTITIVWNEMSPPVLASDGVIVQFLPEQISAIQVNPWSITTFSFFPKMGPPSSPNNPWISDFTTLCNFLLLRVVNFRGACPNSLALIFRVALRCEDADTTRSRSWEISE